MTLDRRAFLTVASAGSASTLTFGLTGCDLSSNGATEGESSIDHPNDPDAIQVLYRDNIYTQLLGVRPHLPAHEHVSRLGGGRMSTEVITAMAQANEFFVDMHELMEAAGARIAELMGAEAALVTAGGFSAMVLGAAGCLTGTDSKRVHNLPQPTWARKECLIQTPHRFSYDRA